MSVETELAPVAEAAAGRVRRGSPRLTLVPRPRPARRKTDFFELGVAGALAGVSVWILLLDLFQVVAHGRVWTGTDGLYLVDQMQYLAWIRDASHHALASNLFVLTPTPADFLQPAVLISGGLSALGVAPWLSLLLWKPVAVAAAFFAVRQYVRRSVAGLRVRRMAFLLALFFGSFTVINGSFGVIGDLFMGFLSWGYSFGLLAVAAMVLALLAYERSRRDGGRRWLPAVLGALASVLHPWQGELLILIVLGTELAMWRRRTPVRRATLPALTVIATALPLAYYAILGRADLSWHLARGASKHSFPIGSIALALAPLALPAAFAYRRRAQGFLALATRAWPLAAVAVSVLSITAFSGSPLHAFEGVTIPLAVLGVQTADGIDWARLRRPRLFAALAVALLTIPATVWQLASAAALVAPASGNANFITGDEQQALRYLATDRKPGGVITRMYLGAVVPEQTGRQTLVGDCVWSQPHCTGRAKTAQRLFDATLTPAVARAFVRGSGARFLLADCHTRAHLVGLLGPVARSVHRFGCASVYAVE